LKQNQVRKQGLFNSHRLPYSGQKPFYGWVIGGLMADRQGNYFWVFVMTSSVMTGGVILNLLATRPKPLTGTAFPGLH